MKILNVILEVGDSEGHIDTKFIEIPVSKNNNLLLENFLKNASKKS